MTMPSMPHHDTVTTVYDVRKKGTTTRDEKLRKKSRSISAKEDETIIIMQGNQVKKIVKRRKQNTAASQGSVKATLSNVESDEANGTQMRNQARQGFVGSIASQLFKLFSSPTKAS
jgi:hypothetical protein